MKRLLRQHSPLLFRAAAVALLLAMIEIVALAAAPAWHEHAHHHDADHGGQDQCAVTLFASGAWQDAEAAPVIVPAPAILPDEVAVERQRIASSFRFSGILEHAPPRRA